MPTTETATKEELIAMVEDLTDRIERQTNRMMTLEKRSVNVGPMLARIDHMIVRMSGQSTHYRDELESIAAEFGFRVPGGISSYKEGA